MNTYKDWTLFDDLPNGWKIDKTAGSPLHGYEFITNGKSVLNKGKRALLRAAPIQNQTIPKLSSIPLPIKQKDTECGKRNLVIDALHVKTVNDLARKKFEQRLLIDIRVDLMVCEIEGWCKKEYIRELKLLINSIGD